MSRKLGLVEGRLRALSKKPNCVSSQTDQSNKYVDPLPFKQDLDATKEAIKNAAGKVGGLVLKTEKGDYMHWVATTPIMKFKDDIELLIDADASLVHYRSASRLGYSDLGANRKRYNRFFQLYQSL